MVSIPTRPLPPAAALVDRRIAGAADRLGNADGVATPAEMKKLAAAVETARDRPFDLTARDRLDRARTAATEKPSQATLDPELRALPAPLRRLALELDTLWGNADGKVSPAELDRVARYYMAAMPFFTKDASALLELADHLGFSSGNSGGTAVAGVVNLRVALARVDRKEAADGKAFRAVFDEAVKSAEAHGAPELLRDALQHSPKWHSLSILEHSAVAVDAVRTLAQGQGTDWKDAGATMLLHDVGKILERQVREKGTDDGHFSFWDHEAAGAQWLQGKGLSQDMLFQIHNHSVLRGKSADEMEALAGSKDRLGRMVLVYVADQVAKGTRPAQLQSFEEQRPKIMDLATRAGMDPVKLMADVDALRVKHYGTTALD